MKNSENDKEAICHRMVLVCGTSTCHMAVARSKLFIPGVWGPFWSGILLRFSGRFPTVSFLWHTWSVTNLLTVVVVEACWPRSLWTFDMSRVQKFKHPALVVDLFCPNLLNLVNWFLLFNLLCLTVVSLWKFIIYVPKTAVLCFRLFLAACQEI